MCQRDQQILQHFFLARYRETPSGVMLVGITLAASGEPATYLAGGHKILDHGLK